MPGADATEQPLGTGVLRRLLRDKRGNTLVLGAISMFPLAGIIGAGVDMSRMYMAKTRLQHACDAGALAGRRMMGGGGWSFSSFRARDTANRFFDANWTDNAYGTEDLTRTYTEANGVVTGNASVKVPMTLMRIFSIPDKPISVTCNAEMRLLNTDVMFTLDTTGSMAFDGGGGQTRMQHLQVAVQCFYQILAQTDILTQDCEGEEPTGGLAPDVQLRFGFMPYSSNVNVGRLLPSNFFPNQWVYQSRRFDNRYDWSSWRSVRVDYADAAGQCQTTNNTSGTQYRNSTFQYEGRTACNYEERYRRPVWVYGPTSINISGLKNGNGWNADFVVPQIGNDLQDERIAWDGCIEEASTVGASTYEPLPSNAFDLNMDHRPTASIDATHWKPVLPALTFWRTVTTNLNQRNNDTVTTTDRYFRGPLSYACPTEARRLAIYEGAAGAANFANYVTSLQPVGGTYHDIGMIWGQRFLSPTGIFSADNAQTPSGGAIERHLIFMTDGDTDTREYNHGAYGVPWYDRRQFPNQSGPPTDADHNSQTNLRFEGLCAAGRRPFTVWVIGFGALSTETRTRLSNCASPGRFFHAQDGAALQAAFRNIAEQIGQLRLRN